MSFQLAEAYRRSGRPKKAVALLKHIKAQANALPPTHMVRLGSQLALGFAYLENSQGQDAIVVLESIVSKAEDAFADHPDTYLMAQQGLARGYHEIGQSEKGVPLLEQVLLQMGRLFNPDHLRYLISGHTLAVAYQIVGQVKRAVPMLERVVAASRCLMGEDHPLRLRSEYSLGLVYLAVARCKGPSCCSTKTSPCMREPRPRTMFTG